MKIPSDNLPDDIRPFDFDRDEHLVIAHVAKLEDSLLGFSRDLGSSATKSSGVRMDYDVVRSYSLRNSSLDTTKLLVAIRLGEELMPAGSYTLAGVSGGDLWVGVGSKFMSAKEELVTRKELQDEMVKLFGGDIVSFLRHIMKDEGEGDEWKK